MVYVTEKYVMYVSEYVLNNVVNILIYNIGIYVNFFFNSSDIKFGATNCIQT